MKTCIECTAEAPPPTTSPQEYSMVGLATFFHNVTQMMTKNGQFLQIQMCYHGVKTCGKGEKWSGMRFVTNYFKILSLNHLVATKIWSHCLFSEDCWQSVRNQPMFLFPCCEVKKLFICIQTYTGKKKKRFFYVACLSTQTFSSVCWTCSYTFATWIWGNLKLKKIHPTW